MSWQKSRADTLAVDLGLDAIRVLEVKPSRSSPAVKFFASQSVAEGSTDTLPERHLSALRELMNVHGVKTKRIVATLPTSLVATRAVRVDRSRPGPIDDQIRSALQNCLPFDFRDLLFDYWPTSGGTSLGSRNEEILVVATQGSVVKRYLDGFEKLKLTCVHLDVAPCAIATLLQRSAKNPEGHTGSISLTAGMGFFAIVENGNLQFWRPFDLTASATGTPPKGPLIPGLPTSLDRLGDEISKCISHMVGSMNVDTLSELILYGHGSDDATVNDYFKNRFHVQVRSPSPFEVFDENGMTPGMRETVDHKTTTQYHTAVGLALQCAGAPIQGANANG